MKAKVRAVTVEAECPHCGGTLLDKDSGSLYINVNQYFPEQEFECETCGKLSRLEAKAWK